MLYVKVKVPQVPVHFDLDTTEGRHPPPPDRFFSILVHTRPVDRATFFFTGAKQHHKRLKDRTVKNSWLYCSYLRLNPSLIVLTEPSLTKIV